MKHVKTANQTADLHHCRRLTIFYNNINANQTSTVSNISLFFFPQSMHLYVGTFLIKEVKMSLIIDNLFKNLTSIIGKKDKNKLEFEN